MGEPELELRNESDRLSTLILYEVAEQADVNPSDLSPPIARVIDTDALEALFAEGSDGFSRVEFTYAGHRVQIQGDEIVQINVE